MNPGHVARACNYKGAVMAQCGGGGETGQGSELEEAVVVRFVEVTGGEDIREKIEDKQKAGKLGC